MNCFSTFTLAAALSFELNSEARFAARKAWWAARMSGGMFAASNAAGGAVGDASEAKEREE
jgi:hypothetical protein